MGEFERIHQSDLTDRQLEDFWLKAILSGRDREVTLERPRMMPDEYVRLVRTEGGHTWLVSFRGVVCGMIRLESVMGRSAQAHFVALPVGAKRTATKGVSVLRGMGLFALGAALWETTMTGSYRLNTIIGMTPACNRRALKYIASIGGQYIATVPDLLYAHDENVNVPGVITIFNRESVPEWCAKL